MQAAPIAILGAGSWGTALALLLSGGGGIIRLWARDPAHVAALRSERVNARYLPGFVLPDAIEPTANLAEALCGVHTAIFAVPSGALRAVARETAPFLPPDALLVSAAKGLEDETGLRMSEVLAELVAGAEPRIVALSGPNLAIEIARQSPTASVAASRNPDAARAVQSLFHRQPVPTFRVYTGTDVVGVELGGAVKNAIAIAAGVCDGLGYGDNAKAALMTRGLNEAIRLGTAQGAQTATFLGLSGVGDLIATGASRLSRNYRVGVALGQGRKLPDILAELGQVAEGVPTTKVLCALAERSGVEMPLCLALRRVLFDDDSAPDLIRALMLRPPKDEFTTGGTPFA